MSHYAEVLGANGRSLPMEVQALGEGRFEVQIEGVPQRVRLVSHLDGVLVLEAEDGRRIRGLVHVEKGLVTVALRGETHPFARRSGDDATAEKDEVHADLLRSPMTGKVLELRCAVGDRVAQGAPLITVEAMKMEHRLDAPRAAKVVQVFVAAGERVDLGAKLIQLEFEDASA